MDTRRHPRVRLAGALTCLLIPLLASCAGRQRTEQAPSPPYKRGERPYSVNGIRYEPLASHKGFQQEGIASSYGADFHGRTTSSGEPFDMNAMTAAHKTLPLGVYVRVRHKRSDREVEVRINDRGPFVGDRIIDLSEAAAEKLGMLHEGLAPVRVTALGYRSLDRNGTPTYRGPESYDRGDFTLQVGAFRSRDNADRLARELRRDFTDADVREGLVSGTRFFRVRVGRYASLKTAMASQQQHRGRRFPGCFVVARD
jgi:rare lipoprotein A